MERTSSWSPLLALPRQAWVLAAGALLNRAGMMVLPFLALYLTRELGLSTSAAGGMLTLYGFGALLAAPAAGRLCDLYGAPRVAVAALFLSGALLLLFPLARQPGTIAPLMLAFAVMTEAFRPASMAMVGELVTPEQRRPAFALYRLAVNLGMSVGPALGGLFLMWWPPALFLINGTTSMLAAAVFVLARSPARASGQELAQGPSRSGAPMARRAYSDLPFLSFLVAILLVGLVFFQQQAALPLYLVQELGLREQVFGLLYTLNTLVIVLLEVPLNSAMSRWPYRWVLALGALLLGAGFGALAFTTGLGGVAATVVIWTFGEMILLPMASSYVAEVAPQGRLGEYMGAFNMVFSLAFMVGPWAGTLLIEHMGSRVLWYAVFACGLASAALMLRVRERPEGAFLQPHG